LTGPGVPGPAPAGSSRFEPPVLWGFPLEEARRRAGAAGWEVEEVLTRPPWPGRPAGRAMVVGQRIADGGRLLLIFAYEEYVRDQNENR
jgi:hypothetical protein